MIQTRIISKRYYINNLDETEYSSEVWDRKEKIEKYDLLIKEGCTEEVILQVVDVPRSTLFRWKQRYKRSGLSGLENESRRPNTLRQSTWTRKIEERVYHLRKKYPLWGKEKIAVMYRQEHQEKISSSTIGRILKKLVTKGRIKSVNFLCHKRITRPRLFKSHAQRWKRDMKTSSPGELLQIDHMTVHVPGHGYVKQFNAICPMTKMVVEKVYKKATSQNAADFLEHAIKVLPFQIRSIQVDGGSEFMKDFEQTCANHQIPLYVLPPRSPECNGNVERSNGTFKYEFYSQYHGGGTFHQLQRSLDKFTIFYNKKRPHQGLGYLTPSQFYSSISRGGGSVSYVLN